MAFVRSALSGMHDDLNVMTRCFGNMARTTSNIIWNSRKISAVGCVYHANRQNAYGSSKYQWSRWDIFIYSYIYIPYDAESRWIHWKQKSTLRRRRAEKLIRPKHNEFKGDKANFVNDKFGKSLNKWYRLGGVQSFSIRSTNPPR